MTPPDDCCREAEVLAAVSTGRLGDELAEHVRSCAACAEVALVASALQGMAEEETLRPLPDPRAIWLRADLARRAEAARTALMPILVLQRLSLALTFALAAFGAVWSWPQIRAWLGSLTAPSLPSLASTASLAHPAVITVIGVGVILMVVVAELVGTWAER